MCFLNLFNTKINYNSLKIKLKKKNYEKKNFKHPNCRFYHYNNWFYNGWGRKRTKYANAIYGIRFHVGNCIYFDYNCLYYF
jgi:hypothetical protein